MPIQPFDAFCERHPLSQDSARIRATGGWFAVYGPDETLPGDPERWVSTARLLGELPHWLARVSAWLDANNAGPVHESVAPTYLTGWYLDAVARAGALWLELAGRVPDLAPPSLLLSVDVWPDGATLRGDSFYCLSGDPAAASPGARPVGTRDDLVARYVEGVHAQAHAFFDAFDPGIKVGSRQSWGMVDDLLEAALLSAAELKGDRWQGLDDGRLATRDGFDPDHHGPTRRSCCFAFRISEGLTCTRCPRRMVRRGPGLG